MKGKTTLIVAVMLGIASPVAFAADPVRGHMEQIHMSYGRAGGQHAANIAERSADMTAYAIARLKDVRMGDEIKTYLARIDATLAPFGGQFIIHGGPKIELEGSWPEDVIVIAFPDLTKARSWYHSAAYQEILALRTGNSSGDVILIEGVDLDHKAMDILAEGTRG